MRSPSLQESLAARPSTGRGIRLSVIIVSHNSALFLPACLRSLQLFLADIEHEVCVVDNASRDGTAAAVRRDFPAVRTIVNSSNLGFAAGVNLGVRHTTGRYVLWMNPDSALVNGGMTTLLDVLEHESSVGIIGPHVTFPDGTAQPSCRAFPSYLSALFNRRAAMTRLFPANRFSREYLKTDLDRGRRAEVDWVSGACLLHR